MKRCACRWKRSVPWILCVCLVMGCATAAYTYLREKDVYRAVYTFYALPDGSVAGQSPLEAARMLGRDCRALSRTQPFLDAVLDQVTGDGTSRMDVVALDGTHLIQLSVTGPDGQQAADLANAAGREMMQQAKQRFAAKNVSEIAQAQVPDEPIGPNRPHKIALVVAVTFVLASVLAFFIGSDRRPVHFDDSPPFGSLGAVADVHRPLQRYRRITRKAAQRPALLDTLQGPIRESVRMSALRLRTMMAQAGARSVTLAGLCAHDGQAPTVLLLAQELAQQGFRVLLVEADDQKPGLNQLLGVSPQADLLDHLTNHIALADVAIKAGRLTFIDQQHDVSLAELASSNAFAAFLRSAETNFDYVLFNAACVDDRADAALLGTATGATVIVAQDGRHSREELEEACCELRTVVRHMGGVLFACAALPRFDRYR